MIAAMASDRAFADEVVNRLQPLGPVAHRAMFGGFGIYLDGVMFGLIAYDTLYFRIDDGNVADYRRAKSEPFTYEGRSALIEMPYWKVPPRVWRSGRDLLAWAQKAHAAARRVKAKKRGPRKSKPATPAFPRPR
jgi:DNA transformation protein